MIISTVYCNSWIIKFQKSKNKSLNKNLYIVSAAIDWYKLNGNSKQINNETELKKQLFSSFSSKKFSIDRQTALNEAFEIIRKKWLLKSGKKEAKQKTVSRNMVPFKWG